MINYDRNNNGYYNDDEYDPFNLYNIIGII